MATMRPLAQSLVKAANPSERAASTQSSEQSVPIHIHRNKRRKLESNGDNFETTFADLKPFSRLEALPAELLEQIFWFALEPNLILASPVIWKLLPDFNALANDVLLIALHQDFEGGDCGYTVSDLPWKTVGGLLLASTSLPIDYRISVQEHVLEGACCTLGRLAPVTRQLAYAFVNFGWLDSKRLYRISARLREDWARQFQEVTDVLHIMEWTSEEDVDKYQTRYEEPSLLLIYSYMKMCIRDDFIDEKHRTLNLRHVPSKVIQGPFDASKISFLVFFRMSFRHMPSDGVRPIFWENTLHNGVSDAIKQGNEEAIYLLLDLYQIQKRDAHCPGYSYPGGTSLHYRVRGEHFTTAAKSKRWDMLRVLVKCDGETFERSESVSLMYKARDRGDTEATSLCEWLHKKTWSVIRNFHNLGPHICSRYRPDDECDCLDYLAMSDGSID